MTRYKKYLFIFSPQQGTAKIIVILLIITGINVAQWLGQPQPFWWEWCVNNKFYSCLMIFFVCNAVEGQLISSGAFEIHFNGLYFHFFLFFFFRFNLNFYYSGL